MRMISRGLPFAFADPKGCIERNRRLRRRLRNPSQRANVYARRHVRQGILLASVKELPDIFYVANLSARLLGNWLINNACRYYYRSLPLSERRINISDTLAPRQTPEDVKITSLRSRSEPIRASHPRTIESGAKP